VNYITVENISKSYGEIELFADLSFSIHKDQKIAFVAKNGSGKTTILNILAGKDVPDSGQVVMRNNLNISTLIFLFYHKPMILRAPKPLRMPFSLLTFLF